jgi:hypothetical protein
MLARQALLLLEPLHQPFFALGIFEIGSCKLFAHNWLRIPILLISGLLSNQDYRRELLVPGKSPLFAVA